jgi:transketolase
MTAAAPDDPSVTLVEEPSMSRISVLVADVDGAVATEERGDGAYRHRAGVRARMGALCQVIGMKTFGASAPLKELQHKFGFEPERIVVTAREMLKRKR